MPRKLRVTTTSFAFSGARSVEGNRDSASAYVDAAGAERADLVCLPETLLHAGIPRPDRPGGETIPGPTFDRLAERARANRVNVVAGLVERRGDLNENVAVVIDRDGQLVGRYSKIHPTTTECELQAITPGCGGGVVDLDVGRVGLAICFDVGWPQVWRDLSERGAELVVWP